MNTSYNYYIASVERDMCMFLVRQDK